MSTLRCTNLQDTSGGNSLTTAQIYNGAAKAWVNFNGTGTVAIRASFNVSSITDNRQADYTVNFSNAMPDANYIVSLAPSSCDVNSVIISALQASGNWSTPTTYTSSAVRVITTGNGGNADMPIFGVVIFR